MPNQYPTEDQLYDLDATAPDSLLVWMGVLKRDSNGMPLMETPEYLQNLDAFLQYATTVMPNFGMRTIVQCPVAALNKTYAQVAVVPYAKKPNPVAQPAYVGEQIYGAMHGMLYDMEHSILQTPVLFDRKKIPLGRQAELANQAFYLFEDYADWRRGSCTAFFGLRDRAVAPSQDLFLAQVRQCMIRAQQEKQAGQDALVFATDGDMLFVVEHFRKQEAAGQSERNTAWLAGLAKPLAVGEPVDVQAPAAITSAATTYPLDKAGFLRHMFNAPENTGLQENL